MTEKSTPLTSRGSPKKQKKVHNIKLDDILNRTKETLYELANKQNSDVNSTLNNEESNPKKLDYYSVDNFENDKPKNLNKNNSNNLLAQLTNESIVINETINGVEEQFIVEIKKIPKEKISEDSKKQNKTKIKIKTNKKEKELETIDDKILSHNIIKKNQEEPKTEIKNKKKKFHKNVSADKIFSKLSDDEDTEFYSTTTRSKRIKNPKYYKSNNKKKDMNRLNSSKTNNLATEKFMETYERFKEKQIKNQKKIEEMKKIQEQKEKKKYRNKPRLNKNSMAMASKLNDDFYARQKKLNEIRTKNAQQLREKLHKKEEDEINKSNILLNRKKKINCRNNSNKKKISNSVNKLYDWDTQRKQRLNFLKKSQDDKFNRENNFNIPRINKNSYKITVNLKCDTKKTTHRLYEDDIKKRIAKQKALEQKYQCSFSPNVNTNSKYEKSRSKKKYCKKVSNNNVSNNNINNVITNVPTCSEDLNKTENVVGNGQAEEMIRTKILGKLFKKKMLEKMKKKKEEEEEEEEEEKSDDISISEKSENSEKIEKNEKSENSEKIEKNENNEKIENNGKINKIKKVKKGRRNNSMINIKVNKMNSSDSENSDFEEIVEKEMREDKKSILLKYDNLYDQWLNGKSSALDKYLNDGGNKRKSKFKKIRNNSVIYK